MTITLENFTDTENVVSSDDRGRITLGAGFKDKKYLVSENEIGQVLLTPVVTIPAHEVWLTRNNEARQSLERGLAQAKAGLGKVMDFSQYANLEIED